MVRPCAGSDAASNGRVPKRAVGWPLCSEVLDRRAHTPGAAHDTFDHDLHGVGRASLATVVRGDVRWCQSGAHHGAHPADDPVPEDRVDEDRYDCVRRGHPHDGERSDGRSLKHHRKGADSEDRHEEPSARDRDRNDGHRLRGPHSVDCRGDSDDHGELTASHTGQHRRRTSWGHAGSLHGVVEIGPE